MSCPARPIEERFWPKVDVRGPKECWPWLASLGTSGYGQIGAGGKRGRPLGSHVVAYQVTYGEVPEGLFVCHACDNKLCCNPQHLFLGTHTDNMRDMLRKGRSKEQKKTRCPKGHPYDTRFPSNPNARICSICHRENTRLASRRMRERRKSLA